MKSLSCRLPLHGTLALLLMLAANATLAQTVGITLDPNAQGAPIPLWATGLLGLMLASLGYWALRKRLPANLHRLRGWPLLAILSVASMATVSSGVWVSRAYAGADTSMSLLGIVTVSTVVTNTDIPVTNLTGQTHTIIAITISGFAPLDAAIPKLMPPTDFVLVPPLTHSPQCTAPTPVTTLVPNGICYVRVELAGA